MEITSENSEQILREVLKRYATYRDTKEHQEKEGYKWEFAKQNADVFRDLNNLYKKIESIGSRNFCPFVWKTSVFRLLANKHEGEFRDALSILFDENIILNNRIVEFIDKLNLILDNEPEWRNKDVKIDVHAASFLLFLKDYKKYFLFPVVKPFEKFAKLFYLSNYEEDILDTSDKVGRYIAWQRYCTERFIPFLKEILGGEPNLLDAEDAMYCISEYFTEDIQLPKKQPDKVKINEISDEDHRERIERLRGAGLLK